MRAFFLLGLAALIPSFASASELKDIERCHVAADSDSSEARMELVVSKDDRGYFVSVITTNTATGVTYYWPSVPTQMRGSVDAPSHTYFTANDAFVSVNLEVYRTSVKERTPTGLNAHFRYFDRESKMEISADRLECNSSI